MSYFKNPTFGIDTTGAFGGIGDSLASNPFGGASLNVGGFTGSTPGYGGGLGTGQTNWGKLAGLQGLANLGLAQMAQSNTATSFNQMQQTGGIFGDIDFGTNLLAQNKDIFEQKDAPRWAAKFQVNDPFYRQFQTRQALANPGLAGRYSAFVS